jgi:3-hydroxyisobutyrate dehydrogenase
MDFEEGEPDRPTGQAFAEPPRIAFIGLGRMGAKMAWRLADKGLRLAVYDARHAAIDQFPATHIRRSRSPEAAVLDCSIVVTALPSVRISAEVIKAAQPAPGTLVIDTSPGNPVDTRGLGSELAERDIALIDAAALGSPEQAATGRLTVLAGGTAEHLQRAEPVLLPLAERVVHCGPIGSGLAMRSLNSLLAAADFATTIETMQIGRRFGLEPDLMVEVLNLCSGGNHATLNEIAPYVLTGRFNSGITLDQLAEDMAAALALATTTKTDVPLSRLAAEIWRFARSSLEPGVDHTALARWYEHRTGTRLRR